MPNNIIECCANSIESAIVGIKAGANRIELCQKLEQGGVTPNYSDIVKLRNITDVKIHILILPIANKFSYTQDEFNQIIKDIIFCKNAKCDGVVIGALKTDGSIDQNLTKAMVKEARPMKVTFHRAFDVSSKFEESLKDIIDCNCDALLTSGQAKNIDQGRKKIAQIIKLGRNRIEIIAGSGVNHTNINELYRLGVRSFHLSGKEKNIFGKFETHYQNINKAVKELSRIED